MRFCFHFKRPNKQTWHLDVGGKMTKGTLLNTQRKANCEVR